MFYEDHISIPKIFWECLTRYVFRENLFYKANAAFATNIYVIKLTNTYQLRFIKINSAGHKQSVIIDMDSIPNFGEPLETILKVLNSKGSVKSIELQLKMLAKSYDVSIKQ